MICDVTRPFPARRVLPVLLEQLNSTSPSRVTIFVATGTHRLCTDAELLEMVGPEVLQRCEVVQHDAFDRQRHAQLGTVLGTSTPALVERAFLEQDVRITTGFIEPHFFAGFSGGPKMVAPGLAAIETVLDLHSAARVGHPQATWGITHGNPIHDAVRDIAARANVTFNLDVTLNREHAITGVFAGDLFESHAAGCAFARETAMAGVDEPYDVVLTTNSGYPLDQNLYQTVKGISAAAQIVKPGGAVLVASECSDGLPDHGQYRVLLRQSSGPADYLTPPSGTRLLRARPVAGPGPGADPPEGARPGPQLRAQRRPAARRLVRARGRPRRLHSRPARRCRPAMPAWPCCRRARRRFLISLASAL